MSVQRLKKEDAVLVAVDFQEKLMPAMKNRTELEETAAKLIKGARVLGVPFLVTQQYTKGLGATSAEIQRAFTEELFEGAVQKAELAPIEKNTFSAMKEPKFVSALAACGRRTVILCGVEAHICVQQTALDLLEAGYQVFVAADCIGSRSGGDKKYGQRRLAQAGAVCSTYEAILYELLGGAGEAGFKQISAIVK